MNMIEASSPLAAMQPPVFMNHCGFRADAPSTYLTFAAAKGLGSNNFNFRDLSMKRSIPKQQQDYFNMQPVRGSSPTASLAADLSQNFHIDQSPQVPTPRRALFANNLPVGYTTHASLTTPPIPSSSPGLTDSMDTDFSPLPHKAPYCSFDPLPQSPTPDLTPAESSIISITSSAVSPMESMSLTIPQERKRSGLLRPSLSRTKGFSTTSIPQKPASESQLPSFKFGNYGCKPATSSSLSLSEIFEQSPVQDKQLTRPNSYMAGLSRPRQQLNNFTSCSRNGSPANQHARKSSNPLLRPRKQFRRSLSMFENPQDVIKQEKEGLNQTILPSIMDMDICYVPQLPHFVSEEQNADLPRITQETMVDVLDGKYNHCYEKLVIIDCRFEYEYSGGHIDGAVNFNDKDQLAAQLFDIEPTNKALLIFHCEYSAHRAPLMAKFIRNKDRTVNADRYPALTYPEAYIMDGGYSAFFKNHQPRCYPQNYIEMDAKEYAFDCERGLGKVKQRSKLVRAQTFAFGQHSSPMNSSPTAMGRCGMDTDLDMDMRLDYTPVSNNRPITDVLRGRNPRMFSY